MDAQETVLRSGHRWRRVPAPRGRKGSTAHPSDSPSAAGEGTREGERGLKDTGRAQNPGATPQFDCNVCLETAKEPVVTHCGHLFCWPCLYRWVTLHSPFRDCPVCKSAVEIRPDCATVTPIYGCPGADRPDGDGGGDPEVPPRPQGRQNRRAWAATLGEALEEVRQRARIQTLDRTRAAIDRMHTNLQAVEGLVREVSLRAARLRFGQMAVEVERVSVTAVSEGTVDQRGSGLERMAGRARRREGDSNTQSGTDNEDGVYRGTRRRRRLATERES